MLLTHYGVAAAWEPGARATARHLLGRDLAGVSHLPWPTPYRLQAAAAGLQTRFPMEAEANSLKVRRQQTAVDPKREKQKNSTEVETSTPGGGSERSNKWLLGELGTRYL